VVKVIVDIGSCHMAKLEYAKEAIDLAVENKCWAIKFQLFKDKSPNIVLPREWWPELVDYAKDRIIIFASAFDLQAVELLKKYNSSYVKFSYSERHSWYNIMKAREFAKVIVSCDLLDLDKYKDDIKLFCRPQYPVTSLIDFSIFKFPFDGFSDHTLGYSQTLDAILYGAQYIEKHITLDHDDIKCPDNTFALKPKELKGMMEGIWNLDK